mgnify:CR=1 FL=1
MHRILLFVLNSLWAIKKRYLGGEEVTPNFVPLTIFSLLLLWIIRASFVFNILAPENFYGDCAFLMLECAPHLISVQPLGALSIDPSLGARITPNFVVSTYYFRLLSNDQLSIHFDREV